MATNNKPETADVAKREAVDISQTLTEGAKNLEAEGYKLLGKAEAFRELDKFFKDNSLEVTKPAETEAPKETEEK